MSTPLRFNEALLITGSAFQPLHCIAWAPQDGNGELNVTFVDRSSTPLGRARLSSSIYSDPRQLEQELRKSREELSQRGVMLEPWCMPA